MADALDLSQLRSFVAIADCGGFSRAAAALHVSQPTVSQHVRLLERRLKQTLVHKVGRRTLFTTDGERLLVEARRILAVHDQALDRLQASTRSRVVIGSTETAAEQVLPGLLTALRDAYDPTTSVRFHIDRSTQMSEAVTRGTLDLAVLLSLATDTPGRRVGVLPLSWFAAPGWRAPETEPIPLVAYREPCGLRQLALAELGRTGRTVEVVAESTTLEGVMAAARAGLGVAVLPTTGPGPDGLVPRPDLPALGAIGVYLVTRTGLDVDLEAAALTALEDYFAGLHLGTPSPAAGDRLPC